MSRQSKSVRTSPSQLHLWHFLRNSAKVTKPLPSASNLPKHSLMEPKFTSAHSLKDFSSSALGGSYSFMLTVLSTSESKARQAPAAFWKFRPLHALRNSRQVIWFESSRSRTFRHALKG